MAVYGRASAPSSGSPDRKRLATSGARAGPTKGVGLRSAADLGARPARRARAARGHELAPAQTDRLISGTLK